MHEILRSLGPDDRVLDLGCAAGSFREEDTAASVVRRDLDARDGRRFGRFVQCDARVLPFGDGSFHAAILNHSLEHFENPATVLDEVRRAVRASGYLYIAVPDSSTLSDRVYRWLGRGGGHVNAFTDEASLRRLIEDRTGLKHVATRLLFSSFAFLNRHNMPGPKPLRLVLLGGGSEQLLRLVNLTLRRIDALTGTRFSVCGWALWFGPPLAVDTRARRNVCVRCGSGHGSGALVSGGNVWSGRLGLRLFRCESCGVANYFCDDDTR